LTDGIKFLGTAGARHVVTRQLRSSGGLWYTLDGSKLLVDPGPGTLVKALSSDPLLDPSTLDAIMLSHRHIDHSSDVNIMIEAMTRGGTRRRGKVLAPHDALENDPVILRYIRGQVNEIVPTSEGVKQSAGRIGIEFPLQHRHPVDTYGYRLTWSGGTICHIVDTKFFPELVVAYRGDILILNVVLDDPDDRKASFIYHLNINNARTLIGEIKPSSAILTHFGTTVLKAGPEEVAAGLKKDTGVEVIAARDGMFYAL